MGGGCLSGRGAHGPACHLGTAFRVVNRDPSTWDGARPRAALGLQGNSAKCLRTRLFRCSRGLDGRPTKGLRPCTALDRSASSPAGGTGHCHCAQHGRGRAAGNWESHGRAGESHGRGDSLGTRPVVPGGSRVEVRANRASTAHQPRCSSPWRWKCSPPPCPATRESGTTCHLTTPGPALGVLARSPAGQPLYQAFKCESCRVHASHFQGTHSPSDKHFTILYTQRPSWAGPSLRGRTLTSIPAQHRANRFPRPRL